MPQPQQPNDDTMQIHSDPRQTTKQTAPVNSLVDVDSPDDFLYEGKRTPLQPTDNKEPWVKVDNPDDYE